MKQIYYGENLTFWAITRPYCGSLLESADQLLTCQSATGKTDFFIRRMDDRISKLMLYIAFSKAFDKIGHIVLVGRLVEVYLCDFLLRCIWSHLNGRRQVICVNEYFLL